MGRDEVKDSDKAVGSYRSIVMDSLESAYSIDREGEGNMEIFHDRNSVEYI